MKKKITGTILVLIIIIVSIGLFFYKLYQPPDFIKKMILDNKSAYDGVANFYYSDFKKNTATCITYSFIVGDTILSYQNISETRSIPLEENVIDMFNLVDSSYYIDDKAVDRVYVYDNFVSLCNENGRKSIVYSVDGTRPQWIDCPGDDITKIKVMQVTKNWYYTECVKK